MPQHSDKLQALAALGRSQRTHHQAAAIAALSKDELQALARSVPLPKRLKVAWLLAVLLAVVVCWFLAFFVQWIGAVLGIACCATLWWSRRQLMRRTIARTLIWPESLPFEVRGFTGWLTDTELLRASAQLWIFFSGDAPKQLVVDALAAVLPDVAPSWFGARAMVVELKHRYLFQTTDTSGHSFAPDLARLQLVVSEVLIPLHGSHPINRLELNQVSAEIYPIRLRREFAARCEELTDNERGLGISEQISELDALRGQLPAIPPGHREDLISAMENCVRRIIIKASTEGDSERASTLTEAGLFWAIDLSENAMHEARLVMAAESKQHSWHRPPSDRGSLPPGL